MKKIIITILIIFILISCGTENKIKVSKESIDKCNSEITQELEDEMNEVFKKPYPIDIKEWCSFTYLDLRGINLEYIPIGLTKMTNLIELDLRSNRLTILPNEIGNLKNLKILGLQYNNLEHIPKEIGNLENLEELYLFKNNLTSLPKEIGNLKNLKVLWLQLNNLNSLPKEMGDLKNLEELDLRENKSLFPLNNFFIKKLFNNNISSRNFTIKFNYSTGKVEILTK